MFPVGDDEEAVRFGSYGLETPKEVRPSEGKNVRDVIYIVLGFISLVIRRELEPSTEPVALPERPTDWLLVYVDRTSAA